MFGKKHDLHPYFDGNAIEWVDRWTYLGVAIKSPSKFNCCIDEQVKAFYRSVNGILRIDGGSCETVMLQLIEAHSIPNYPYSPMP